MAWKQIEATGPHLTYMVLSLFLISYALFSFFIRNRLHLSEPPLATLFGILFGPFGAGVLQPSKWGLGDSFVQEFTRIVVGIQCFAVGIELPKFYFNRHWKSIAIMLGPVMTFGWIVCATFIYWLFGTDVPTALIISACLTPTDPVLAASVLSNSQFSTRVPARIRHLLSAESGCNDGVSFPFIYVGICILTKATVFGSFKKWFLIVILWQCAFGIFLGLLIGWCANHILRFSSDRHYVGRASYLVFYLLLATFSIGVASTLGVDDFLVAFGAGYGFGRDGWFSEQIAETRLPNIIDLLVNSSFFVYFGASIPWQDFGRAPKLNPGLLILLLVLILLLRRLPIVLALHPFIPDIHTVREALFCGHFGPMGVGALFLAIEARAQLESGTSEPDNDHPHDLPPERQRAVEMIWPMICFIVLGSTVVHGLSTLFISLSSHFLRPKGERAPLIGGETDAFHGMSHEEGDGDSAEESEDDVEGDRNESE
ncbi:hypothetical protein H2201_002279 [Coniosporium apollinis]|uniref:Cation/H+ exchanger transmembrane domain-containing protein n=1 Tax=Coniosporium apollinis TaxID=61459 RepID=A0ABQ9P2H1_9PEZI|nr:hypothetical protein H2201_002279 [Coniosporium apollinis]